jgi:glucose-1-phosphate adenylyltransferase
MTTCVVKPIATSNVLAVIMGGGAGTRLFPLTKERAKPAVPIAGKYRLVDIPISNCLNSEMRRIYVLTQFNSASLHRHIHQTYRFDRFAGGFVEVLAARQTPDNVGWYQGTADAVRQNLRYLLQEDYDYIVILSGDQLYRLDFRQVLQQHIATSAEITVAVIPVKQSEAKSLGILQLDAEKRIVRFVEKPKTARVLGGLAMPDKLRTHLQMKAGEDQFLASMGIYIFNREVLRKALANNETDFGKNIIPEAINRYRVFGFVFQGYWQDVGTIRSFFNANIKLCASKPSFNFFDRHAPVYTHARFLPASKIVDSQIRNSLIAEGCIILKSRIERSIVGVRSFISNDCELSETIIMGCDFYQAHHEMHELVPMDIPHMSIGRGCRIKRAIIDKNAHIGDDVIITDQTGAPDFDGPTYCIRDGIVVIPRNAVIPAGTRI